MTHRVEGGVTYTQTFDAENHLTAVWGVSGGTTVVSNTFYYDGDGNLVKTGRMDGSTTIYVGGSYEVLTQGGVTTTTTYYNALAAHVMRVTTSTASSVYYILTDQLGSASVTLDSSGNVVGQTRFYAFGETRLTTGSMVTDKLYTGQRNDSYTELYWIGSRWYDPALARWIQPDTIVPKPSDPQALNRYSYALNSPMRYTDPSGHMVSDDPHWASAFEQATGRPPTPQDKFDADFAETHRGSGANGQWTNADWHKYTEVKTAVISAVKGMVGSDKGRLSDNRPTSLVTQRLPIGTDVSGPGHGSRGDLDSSPWPCDITDCVLSIVGTLASGVATATWDVQPEVALPAEVVDVVVAVVSIARIEGDYQQGKISNTRHWALDITQGVGVLTLPPPLFPLGFVSSLFNMILTFSGQPP